MSIRGAPLILALMLFGCGEVSTGSPSPRPPSLRMAPKDLTSAVGAPPLQVLVANEGRAVTANLLAPVAAEVGLVSWPEGEAVPVSTQVQAFEPSRSADGWQIFGSGTVTVMPAAPLDDRWYFLHLAVAPAGVTVVGPTELYALDDGRVGARFTLGSDPRMTWVRRCLGGPSGKVIVEFSEAVVLDSAEALSVEASGACSIPSPSFDAAITGSSFSFRCDGLADSPSVRVLLASTVTAVGGRPVRGAGVAMEFPVAAFNPATSTCPAAAVPQE
jgi:hypothetical protein